MVYFTFPIYNEEHNIQAVIPAVRKLMSEKQYKIVAVNDGSSDGSGRVIKELMSRDIIVEETRINMNIGAVFSLAIDRVLRESESDDDIMIIMESDQTSEVDLIKEIIKEIEERGNDIVIASRYQKGGGYRNFPIKRIIASRCANYFLKKVFPIKPEVIDYTIFMRGYRVRVLRDSIECFGLPGLIQSHGFIANSELLIKTALFTKKIKEVPFIYDYGRKIGKSKMNVIRTINEYFTFTQYMKNLIVAIKTERKRGFA